MQARHTAAVHAAWQTALWNFVPIGSYRYGNTVRQVANDPAAGDTQPIRLALKPTGQNDVLLHLMTRDTSFAKGTDSGDIADISWSLARAPWPS